MKSVLVFSGTSEGRELCEKLAKEEVFCNVFVATEYGEAVMPQDKYLSVHTGRLNKDEIKDRISEYCPDYVIDATHPHAVEITNNIKTACIEKNVIEKYIRVLRNIEKTRDFSGDKIQIVASTKEAVNAVKSMDGNVLLTTGVKELEQFCVDGIKDRLVARILPGMESIEKAVKCGIPSKNIVAMEGPFSVEMNEALISQYNIGVLVTKNSGSRGGFEEKINACKASGISAVVIERPSLEDGISIDRAVEIVAGKVETKTCSPNDIKKKISLVGMGVCSEEYLIPKAKIAIESAQLLIGASRMIKAAEKLNTKAEGVCEYNPKKVIDAIEKSDAENICILFSGDTGLCSGAKGVKEAIEESGITADIKIIPGISSISYFASAIGVQYSDYPFISFHGRELDILDEIKGTKGFFAICSGRNDVTTVYNKLPDYRVIAGKNLGSETEEIINVNSSNCERLDEGLYVIFVEKK